LSSPGQSSFFPLLRCQAMFCPPPCRRSWAPKTFPPPSVAFVFPFLGSPSFSFPVRLPPLLNYVEPFRLDPAPQRVLAEFHVRHRFPPPLDSVSLPSVPFFSFLPLSGIFICLGNIFPHPPSVYPFFFFFSLSPVRSAFFSRCPPILASCFSFPPVPFSWSCGPSSGYPAPFLRFSAGHTVILV